MNTLSFHMHLLTDAIGIDQFPFTKLVIENELSEREYDELFMMLEELNNDFIHQQSEGLLDFTGLLVHFAGMLNPKMHPDETIVALQKEGHYPALMEKFISILNYSNRRSSRRK